MASKPKINKMITKVNFSDSNRSAGQIKYLVKHFVGATGGAEANCRYFYDTYRGASAHFFVGHNGEIWQCVEENDTAWHCGAKTYKHKECRNSNSIGVELCVKKDANGQWYYTEETKKAAIQLFAYLMDKYGIDEKHVLRHYDVTGKICGEPDVRSGNKEWSAFKSAISSYGKRANSTSSGSPSESSASNGSAASSGVGVIGFFMKRWISDVEQGNKALQQALENTTDSLNEKIEQGNRDIQEKIQKNDEKVNERINKLEENTGKDIQHIKQEINDIKGDFATTFVLREDFFRSMNGVEDKIGKIDNKLDRLLLMGKEK